jgi:hypothetical protein
MSSEKKDTEKKIELNSVNVKTNKTPKISVRTTDDGLKFRGEKFNGFSKGVDDFPYIINTDWFDGNLLRHETYGGLGTDGDLSCLFYSVLKSISPDMQKVTASWEDLESHTSECAKIAHSFKLELVEYLLSDLKKDENISETMIKKRNLIYDDMKLSEYFKVMANIYDSPDKITELKLAVSEHKKLLEIKVGKSKQLKEKSNQTVELGAIIKKADEEVDEDEDEDEEKEKEKEARMKLYFRTLNSYNEEEKFLEKELEEITLLIFESDYNRHLKLFESSYEDPRYFKPLAKNYDIEEKKPVPYFFPKEIRDLPITTGMFNIPEIFSSERSYRSEEYNLPDIIPLEGTHNLKNIIENMVYPCYHNENSFSFISQILNINIFTVESNGAKINKYCNRDINCDIIDLFINYYTTGKIEDITDKTIPNIFVCNVESRHYENMSLLLHYVDEKNKPKYYFQTVFSYDHPLVTSFLGKDKIKPKPKPKPKPEEKDEPEEKEKDEDIDLSSFIKKYKLNRVKTNHVVSNIKKTFFSGEKVSDSKIISHIKSQSEEFRMNFTKYINMIEEYLKTQEASLSSDKKEDDNNLSNFIIKYKLDKVKTDYVVSNIITDIFSGEKVSDSKIISHIKSQSKEFGMNFREYINTNESYLKTREALLSSEKESEEEEEEEEEEKRTSSEEMDIIKVRLSNRFDVKIEDINYLFLILEAEEIEIGDDYNTIKDNLKELAAVNDVKTVKQYIRNALSR